MTDLTPAVREQQALIFQAWRCILAEGRSAIYVSGPITTGPRFVAARISGEPGAERHAFEANLADLLEAAATLRRDVGRIVIEPASLTMQAWSQEDYLALWTTLIERHITEVRFLDGWALSIGCALEFERAVRHELPCLRMDGSTIDRATGCSMIEREAARLTAGSDAKLALLGQRLCKVAASLA